MSNTLPKNINSLFYPFRYWQNKDSFIHSFIHSWRQVRVGVSLFQLNKLLNRRNHLSTNRLAYCLDTLKTILCWSSYLLHNFKLYYRLIQNRWLNKLADIYYGSLLFSCDFWLTGCCRNLLFFLKWNDRPFSGARHVSKITLWRCLKPKSILSWIRLLG